MGASLHGQTDWRASGVSIDTRTLMPGDLFFALTGPSADGHDYAAQALDKGAACVVVARDIDAPAGATMARVGDTLQALGQLGIAARARTAARICAVTGSVGKTGTKEGLRHILAAQGRTHAAVASYNNHIGVPLTLARMPADTAYGVFELGMNHAGEIAPLAKMVRPDVALITNVEAVHIENFASVDGIADAKAEIFDGLTPGGTAVLNRDNRYFDRLRTAALASGDGRIISFGNHEEADARLLRVALKPQASCVAAMMCGHEMTYKIGMPGAHIVQNSLAMLACTHALGGDIALAGLALASLKPPAGRGERIEVHVPHGRFLVIDESYNANPRSMEAVLQALGSTVPGPKGRRIAVLGDMLELGDHAPAAHAGLTDPIVDADVDLVFACGPLMAHLWAALPDRVRGAYAETSTALAQRIAGEVGAGDVVMVKGSLGSRMAAVVEALKAHGVPAMGATERERA